LKIDYEKNISTKIFLLYVDISLILNIINELINYLNYITFRRISYGNLTHVNISVTVGEDNRAILGVALDKSDSVYFGCDAGCLDAPVPLDQTYTNFPVKLTKPLTAILYITSDHQHMQDLRNALHVHEVDDGRLRI